MSCAAVSWSSAPSFFRSFSWIFTTRVYCVVEAARRLLSQNTTQLAGGQVGLGSERQRRCAQAALEAVVHGLEVAQADYTLDTVVQDLEEALEALGEITGEVTSEDILDTVFSRFCLGK